MKNEIEIVVKDGAVEYTCRVGRPSIATLSRVAKLGKADEVLAAQELLKGCWISGDEEIKQDPYLMLAVVGKIGTLQEGIRAEIKNS